MEIYDNKDWLMHYGVGKMDGAPGRGSGRFELGSGENPNQRLDKSFMNMVSNLKNKGMSETDIAKGLGISTTQLRAYKMIARENTRRAEREEVLRLTDQGLGATEIGRIMGKPESSIRALRDDSIAKRTDETRKTADILKRQLKSKKYLLVGPGNEVYLGVSDTKFKTALALLKTEGYVIHNLFVDQLGTGHKTTTKVLCPPGTEYKDLYNDKDNIHGINERVFDTDGSVTALGMAPVKSVSSKRVQIRYAEDGGIDKDGVIELRRGVDDISLGKAQYAQVRIGVDDTHYLKGMAMYGVDMPDGIDIVFNTNKKRGTPMSEVLKEMKKDSDNPFGATIKGEEELKKAQRYYIDKDGKKQISPINIVNEEGDWGTWSKTLASQMLSKQPVPLAKKQLELAYYNKAAEFDEISKLTNPTIKKRLLLSFADDCDSSAVHLKAAHLPGQTTRVILPVPSLKETEVYAPHLNNGEKVVLIRYPHGGQFEIPELTVNNKNKEANAVMHNATDAIGISPKVAEVLSGADFDGDSVVCIPITRNGVRTVNIQTKPPLEGLKNFDTKSYKMSDESYKIKYGENGVSKRTCYHEMGVITNLITDMSLQGAPLDDLARAVRYSMVIIDTPKHHLDYKQAAKDNDIRSLKKIYQSGGGVNTIISRAKSTERVPERKDMYSIDPDTGKKIYRETGRSHVDKNGKTVYNTTKSTKMAEAEDARTLMSSSTGLPMERVYADHANKLKALANRARKEYIQTKELDRSPSAAITYAKEVNSLNNKLQIALKNKPKEQQAQLIAGQKVSALKRDNPDATEEQIKKWKGQALNGARARLGAKKERVTFTDKEWEAVQAGAISKTKLNQLINNAELDHVKKLATPKNIQGLTTAQISRIKAMSNSTFSIAEIADALNLSPSTISKYINQ